MTNPILSALRGLLKHKGWTTVPELARYTGLKSLHVLGVVNRNAHLLDIEKSKGRIAGERVQSVLSSKLWKSGNYYSFGQYGEWYKEGESLNLIEGHYMFERLAKSGVTYKPIILDTPENRAALEAEGIMPWSTVVLDDREWNEEIHD